MYTTRLSLANGNPARQIAPDQPTLDLQHLDVDGSVGNGRFRKISFAKIVKINQVVKRIVALVLFVVVPPQIWPHLPALLVRTLRRFAAFAT